MPKKDNDNNAMVSETGNWNVADDYSKSKIMRPLIMADYYEDVSIFGYESISEELINYASPPDEFIKISAMRRYIKILIRVIDNSKFALKKEKTRQDALSYKAALEKLYVAFEKIIVEKYDHNSRKMQPTISNQILFNKILNEVSKIKSKINEPLNKNHLIFVDKEEFDPRAFKNSIKERMVNNG